MNLFISIYSLMIENKSRPKYVIYKQLQIVGNCSILIWLFNAINSFIAFNDHIPTLFSMWRIYISSLNTIQHLQLKSHLWLWSYSQFEDFYLCPSNFVNVNDTSTKNDRVLCFTIIHQHNKNNEHPCGTYWVIAYPRKSVTQFGYLM